MFFVLAGLLLPGVSASDGAWQKNTERMKNLVKAATKKDAQVVFLDIEQGKRAEVWAVSGKKGVYPLLFHNDNFLGDMAEIETLNEIGELAAKLGQDSGAGGPLVPQF
jgi:hypothetical protein